MVPEYWNNTETGASAVSQTVSHWLSEPPNSLLHRQLELEARVGIEPSFIQVTTPNRIPPTARLLNQFRNELSSNLLRSFFVPRYVTPRSLQYFSITLPELFLHSLLLTVSLTVMREVLSCSLYAAVDFARCLQHSAS